MWHRPLLHVSYLPIQVLKTSLQTGAGKTFTMEGVKGDPELEGVIPRSFHHIFDRISNAPEDERYLVRASYLEIYQEEIRDLLSKVKKFLELYVFVSHYGHIKSD